MSDFIRKNICDGVAFGSVTDDRFKIGRLSSTLIVPLSKETAAANALLSCVLTRSCKKYPDFTALNRKLDSLYGAALYPSVNQIGDHQTLTISVTGIDDRYALDGESVSSELAELLCSILFEPNVVDGHFADDDVEQERRQLIENIDSEYNDKRLYAIKRCVELMCRDEIYSIGRFGSRQDVENLTHENIYSAWKNLLEKSRVELTMLGNSDVQKAYDGFEKYFKNRPRTFHEVEYQTVTPENVIHESETEDVSQSKLVMGFRCSYFKNDEDCLANSLMSAVLGGTPTSKLFLNVREKESLCYYCVSRVDNNKGIMLIDSGVETKNIEKTEEAVLKQLDALKNGEVTDSEIDNAKLAIKNSLMSSLDNLGAIQSFYTSKIMRDNRLSPLKAAEAVDRITKDRIIELAQNIELDTVFALRGN
ncbi:MAG: insulinase family protein [Clostridia bacterium]|nr:insulinase family protein [Clostridia bacterium]